jgi:hypothetical protein
MTALFAHLGVETARGLFAQPDHLLSPSHLWMLRDIVAFNQQSIEDYTAGKLAGLISRHDLPAPRHDADTEAPPRLSLVGFPALAASLGGAAALAQGPASDVAEGRSPQYRLGERQRQRLYFAGVVRPCRGLSRVDRPCEAG